MKIRFNYYLKIRSIMKKEFDEFDVNEKKSLKEIIFENIEKDKIDQIDLSELLIICGGKNVDSIDMMVEKDTVFSICPKIYGG
ncbi:MAG: hypothetical protein IK997_07740 [Bacilli bacterium]|nr:hypothetical protein [Bacilli bacterium]